MSVINDEVVGFEIKYCFKMIMVKEHYIFDGAMNLWVQLLRSGYVNFKESRLFATR